MLEEAYRGVHTAGGRGARIGYTIKRMEELKEGGRSYLERIATPLGDKGISAGSEVRGGEVPREIIRFADEIQARLVAMSKRGRCGMSPLDLGSVADKVLRRGTTPAMLVSAPKGK